MFMCLFSAKLLDLERQDGHMKDDGVLADPMQVAVPPSNEFAGHSCTKCSMQMHAPAPAGALPSCRCVPLPTAGSNAPDFRGLQHIVAKS